MPTPAIETRYLYHALRFALDDIRALGSGAVFPEVGKKTLAAFEIPLPPKNSQQRRIAAKLDHHVATLDRARTSALAQLAAIDVLSGTLLRQAFKP